VSSQNIITILAGLSSITGPTFNMFCALISVLYVVLYGLSDLFPRLLIVVGEQNTHIHPIAAQRRKGGLPANLRYSPGIISCAANFCNRKSKLNPPSQKNTMSSCLKNKYSK